MKFTYCLLLGLVQTSLAQDSINVQRAIDLVNLDSLVLTVRQLAGEVPAGGITIRTRASEEGRAIAADYLYQKLQRYGLSVSKQPYTRSFQGTNVVAVQRGTEYPDVQYIICAHYDSYLLTPPDTCPGADDNASGVAIVLESARILSQFPVKYTVIYAFWDQEEYGSIGSYNYVLQAYSRGDNIAGVINVDQFGWDSNNDNLSDLHTRPIANSVKLADTIAFVNTKFQIGLNPITYNPGGMESDQSSFWIAGFSAVWIGEASYGRDIDLYRHSSHDSLKYFNLPYFLRGAKLAVGSMARIAEIGAPAVTVACKVLLQGPYTGSAMSTTLKDGGLLPLSQPYSTSPWNYAGSESVLSIPAGVVDWVLLELRTGTAAVSAVGSRAAFLKSDGNVVDLDGINQVVVSGVAAGSYYIILRHRNHLAVMSAAATALSTSGSPVYDFTTGAGQYYGGQAKDLGGGIFGMFAGSNDGDNIITVLDYNAVGRAIFTTGYPAADHDMDGLITVLDYNSVGSNIFMMSNVP